MKAVQMIGRYRIEATLGAGAMGEVYRAYDPLIDRPVAIKVVRPELISGGGSEQWLQRFRREARAAGRRFHPNVIAVLDFGDDNGVPFLAMEYVDGRSLDAVIKASGPLEPSRGVPIITQVLSALGFIHENGVVHRDVKPSNIMVLESGQIKIADFGIARIDTSEFTIVGDLLGTPAYMAPEQFAGAPVDARTDLFAAGVILFEMLTGIKPFRGKSITEILCLMETRGPEDIGLLNPAVPDALKQVIGKALAFDRAARYASADEFATAIAEAFVAPTVGGSPTEVADSVVQPDSVDPHPEIRATNSSLDPALLEEIERDLATFIGPVAAIAVRRAALQTNDLLSLYDKLGRQLENPRDQAEFLARGRQRAAAAVGLSRTSSLASPRPDTERNLAPPAAPADPAVVSAVEVSLARHIGPIAKILVRRELDKYQTMERLYLALARHISDERDREAFLRTLQAN
jgi:eukaryotic-like serine/threonine-protein kinase